MATKATTKMDTTSYGEAVQCAAYVGLLWNYSEWGACGVDDDGLMFCDCPTWEKTGACRHTGRATRLGLPDQTYWYLAEAGPQVKIGFGDGRSVTLRRVEEPEAPAATVRAA